MAIDHHRDEPRPPRDRIGLLLANPEIQWPAFSGFTAVNDLPLVVDLYNQVYKPAKDVAFFQRRLRNREHSLILLAVVDGRLRPLEPAAPVGQPGRLRRARGAGRRGHAAVERRELE